MKGFSFGEFRPTLIFLSKFLGLYLVGNLLYGLYVSSFDPAPDPVTRWVSEQTGIVLEGCGWPIEVRDHARKATSLILHNNRSVLAVYEGCNGLNTIIIFISFLFAFGPVNKTLLWFLPLGIVIIHVANLFRISLLFFTAELRPDYMYFVHKYLFTAFIYLVIFVLWIWWVKKFAVRKVE